MGATSDDADTLSEIYYFCLRITETNLTKGDVEMKQFISQRNSSKTGFGLTLATFILPTILLVCHILVSHRSDLPMLIGDRSEAIFDLWSFQHFCSGILIGSLLVHIGIAPKATWQKFVLIILVLALGWETAELAMESGLFGQAIANWKHGFEHWGNRFIGDPLMVTLGGLFARRFKSAWKWVLIPASVWLIVNIASPNSMSVQQLLFGL